LNDLTLLLSPLYFSLCYKISLFLSLLLTIFLQEKSLRLCFLCCALLYHPSERGCLCVFEFVWSEKQNVKKINFRIKSYWIYDHVVTVCVWEWAVCAWKKRKRQVPCKVILYLLFNNSNLIFSFLLFDSDCM
jgi:hypothetical protein